MQNLYLGIEIGGTKVQAVIGDEQARILKKVRFSVDREAGAKGIKQQLKEAVAQLLQETTVTAVGIGFGGPVDWRTGKVSVSHHIEGWEDFEMAAWLGALCGNVPVYVDNDANAAALGEALRGAGTEYAVVFYVTMGSGVGGGLVANGAIYHGASPGEAEIGHIRLNRKGDTVESKCSGWAVDAKVRAAIQKEPKGVLAQLRGGQRTREATLLTPALKRGDAVAKKILRDTATDLAFALSHAVHLFHPEIIILGGGLSLLGEPLRRAVAEALPSFIMQAFLPGPSVQLAKLGEDVVPVGALEIAIKRYKQSQPANESYNAAATDK